MFGVRPRAFVFAAVVSVAMFATSTAAAQDFSFEPWSDVSQVCPTCEPPAADVIELSDGETVEGIVRAINPEFHTVTRFGEVRTVPTSEVENIDWEGGERPDGLEEHDQIVLDNGHVLTGDITIENQQPPYYEIESSYLDHTYTAFKSQIAMVFMEGEEHDFESELEDATDIRESEE